MRTETPARENEVAVTTFPMRHIQLIQMGCGAEVPCQQMGLIVIVRTPHVAIHFLQANEIRVLFADDINDSFQSIAPIAADSLVNVVR